MTGLIVEQRVFKYLLDLKFPRVTSHLEKLQVDIEPLLVRWFLCLFVSVLPLEVLFKTEASDLVIRPLSG